MLASVRAGPRIVAVGDHGIVLLSDDGGVTHRQAQRVPVDVALTAVSFVDDRRGWAVGHWGVVLQTVDGGETWTLQRSDTQEDRPLFGVHFFDANHGVAVGLWSLVLTTSDGGAHWQVVEMPVPEGARRADLNLLGVFADGRGRLYAPAERGTVLRSDDRGQHWRYLNTGYQGSFWTGIAEPDGALLVAGLRGSLFRSTDEGQSWQRIDTHSKSSITALALTGHRIVGVGLDGLVLRSDDAGVSFSADVRADRLPLTAVSSNEEGSPVLYSRQGVVTAPAAQR
ncbi:MAG: YCF48-related protein [Burkholderiales bacterium]